MNNRSRSTIVKLEVMLRDKGIGSPYDQLPDQVRVVPCCNQSCDSSITPPKQREFPKAQSLSIKWKILYITNKVSIVSNAQTNEHAEVSYLPLL